MLGGRQLCRGEEKALRGDVVCEEGNYPDQAMLLVVEALSLQVHAATAGEVTHHSLLGNSVW